MIRILVAEHLPLVRRGLVASLDGESDCPPRPSSRILSKTGARNRVDAVRIATDAGWL